MAHCFAKRENSLKLSNKKKGKHPKKDEGSYEKWNGRSYATKVSEPVWPMLSSHAHHSQVIPFLVFNETRTLSSFFQTLFFPNLL